MALRPDEELKDLEVGPPVQELDRVEITGRNLNPLKQVFSLAASNVGLDTNDPKTSALIDRKVEELSERHPDKSGAELAMMAKQNVPQLLKSFMAPAAGQDINVRQQSELANKRDILSREVENRADVSRTFAPFNTNVRDTINGGQGKYAADYVKREYAPLEAFDAQAKAMKEARTSDQEAEGKVFTNQQEQGKAQVDRTKATAAQTDLANKQMDNDPESKVSKINVHIAKEFLRKFDLPDIPQLEGATKVQVDEIMGGVIKSALANAKTEQERNNLIALVKEIDSRTDKLIEEARVEAVDAYIAEQVGKGRGMNPADRERTHTPPPGAGRTQLPGKPSGAHEKPPNGTTPAGRVDPGGAQPDALTQRKRDLDGLKTVEQELKDATDPEVKAALTREIARRRADLANAPSPSGQTAEPKPGAAATATGSKEPLPGKWHEKYSTVDEQAAQKQQAEVNTNFKNSARSRDRLKSALADARELITKKDVRTGWLVGEAGRRFSTAVQELDKALATVTEENGFRTQSTDYRAALNAATAADVTRNPDAILKVMNVIEAQVLKDEIVGQASVAAQGRPFDESGMRNNLVALNVVDPKTNESHIKIIDKSKINGNPLELTQRKYPKYKISVVGSQ